MDTRRVYATSVTVGCYEAPRAAALSGVPLSTVYEWARRDVVKPSISLVREMLWSYADLVALRIVSWLRHPKETDGTRVPASPMPEVRATLDYLASHGIDLWSADPSGSSASSGSSATGLSVDRTGKVWVSLPSGEFVDHAGGATLELEAEYLELLKPFSVGNQRGPDLLRPRPHLRITPSRVAGEPHVAGSRITTRSIAALDERGFDAARIATMYSIDRAVVDEALDLERQLKAA